MENEVAKLWLNTGSLTTTQQVTGITTANFMSSTFNFDLRIVLGEAMFQKYTAFKMYYNDTYGLLSASLGMGTLYQNGLNLINASYQGKPAGFQTAIVEENLAQNVNNLNYLGSPSNLREFVLIKPDNANIQLTLEWIDEAGTTATITKRPYFFCFVPYVDNKIYKNPYNQLYQNEQVNFTLSTLILTTGSTTSFGTCNANRTIYTFSNINMRNILGTLFDKYEKFNLIVKSVGLGNSAEPSSGVNRRLWWEIEGLQFINTLQVTTGYKQGNAFTPAFLYNTVNRTDCQYEDPPMSITTFRKPESENVNLSFYVWSSNGGGELMTVGPIGQQTFTFSVVGVQSLEKMESKLV
jgi:hypothetical protein